MFICQRSFYFKYHYETLSTITHTMFTNTKNNHRPVCDVGRCVLSVAFQTPNKLERDKTRNSSKKRGIELDLWPEEDGIDDNSRLEQSSIHNIGVFAAVAISENVVLMVSESESDILEAHYKQTRSIFEKIKSVSLVIQAQTVVFYLSSEAKPFTRRGL